MRFFVGRRDDPQRRGKNLENISNISKHKNHLTIKILMTSLLEKTKAPIAFKVAKPKVAEFLANFGGYEYGRAVEYVEEFPHESKRMAQAIKKAIIDDKTITPQYKKKLTPYDIE